MIELRPNNNCRHGGHPILKMVHSPYVTSWGKGGIYTFITSQPPTSEPPGDEVKNDGINVNAASCNCIHFMAPTKKRVWGKENILLTYNLAP